MIKNLKIFLYFLLILLISSGNIFAKDIMIKKLEGKTYKIKANGNLNLLSSNYHQHKSYENSLLDDNLSKNYNKKGYNLVADGELDLIFTSQISSKIKTKIGANFEFNIDDNKRKHNPYLDQIYISNKNKFGRFEAGNIKPVNQRMKYDPASFARGAGGIKGKYLEHINLPILADYNNSINGVCQDNISDSSCANVKVPSFVMLSQSPIGHGGYVKSHNSKFSDNDVAASEFYNSYAKDSLRSINDDSFEGVEDATKISYFSPDLNGFKFGLSYTPDSQNNGLTKNIANTQNNAKIKDIFSFGLNYLHYLPNGAYIALSTTAEKGNSVSKDRSDLLAYDFGINLNYFGFDIGASYGIWESYSKPNSGSYSCSYDITQNLLAQDCSVNAIKYNDPYYFSAGIAYKFGPLAASLTSFNSNFHNNKFRAMSFGIDYKLKKYLMPYFEITKFNFQSDQARASNISNQNAISSGNRQIRDNEGLVFLTGIFYSF